MVAPFRYLKAVVDVGPSVVDPAFFGAQLMTRLAAVPAITGLD
jgi:hypothetical protein